MSQKTPTFQGMGTFYVIWFGQLISTLGSRLTSFALGVWIYENTNSVTLFAINTFAFMATTVLVSPFAGALVDKWNRRWVMVMSDAGAGLSTLAIWFLFFTGKMEIQYIYIVTIFNAAFTAFQFPAHSAATTMLVPKKQLGRAGGMVQIGQAILEQAYDDLLLKDDKGAVDLPFDEDWDLVRYTGESVLGSDLVKDKVKRQARRFLDAVMSQVEVDRAETIS